MRDKWHKPFNWENISITRRLCIERELSMSFWTDIQEIPLKLLISFSLKTWVMNWNHCSHVCIEFDLFSDNKPFIPRTQFPLWNGFNCTQHSKRFVIYTIQLFSYTMLIFIIVHYIKFPNEMARYIQNYIISLFIYNEFVMN